MLGFVLALIPWKAISNLELRRSCEALHDDLVLLSAATLSNICWRYYSLTADAMGKQLPSPNEVSFALEGWTSTNRAAISSFIVYDMDRNVSLRGVPVAFDGVDCLFFSAFKI